MSNVSYQKRQNAELFKRLEQPESLHLTQLQNYVPSYKRFFNLNESNFNSINFNHPWFLFSVGKKIDPTLNLYECKLRNSDTKKVRDAIVFFKLAPLLDPVKLIIGKYDVNNPKLFELPSLAKNDDCMERFTDPNNAAYVDSLFLYLSSQLLSPYHFVHKVDYYGSFLGIKKNFQFNIFDDLEYLINSDFFMKNKNILFQVDNFDHIISLDEPKEKKPLQIGSAKSHVSVDSFHDEIFNDVFTLPSEETRPESGENDLEDMMGHEFEFSQSKSTSSTTFSSNSSCSSRTSYTEAEDEFTNDFLSEELLEDNKSVTILSKQEDADEDEDEKEEEERNIIENEDSSCDNFRRECEKDHNKNEEGSEWTDDNSCDEEDDEDDYEEIMATLPKFPVHVICMEDCEETFDSLILENDLKEEEMLSAFMQVIMILLTYQKTFALTHNDLHTNNVMFVPCERKFLFYKYQNKIYKVPTFGRLFKIIDFGRSIFKYKDQTFCSDSYRPGGDACSQYNIEPYLNENKPRLEPNFSFDLCRLGCALFDHLVEDMDEVKDLSKCDPVTRIVVEWCTDDKGLNMLYKNNGQDRYPDFKLYKMIARCVHNHTPQKQLERPEFKAYISKPKKGEKEPNGLIDIDSMVPMFT
jgi:hypothetical protein